MSNTTAKYHPALPAQIILLFFFVLSSSAQAKDVTVATMLDNPALFDGKEVSLIGMLAASSDGAYLYDEQNRMIGTGSIADGTEIENITAGYGVLSRIRGVYFHNANRERLLHSFEHVISVITSVEPYIQELTGSPVPYALRAIITVKGIRKAFLSHLPDGQGYTVAPGVNMRGVLPVQILAVEPDKIVAEERCQQCTGATVRRVDVYLKK